MSDEGYVLFSDTTAAAYFESYVAWAEAVSERTFKDDEESHFELIRFYISLQQSAIDPPARAPVLTDIEYRPAWVDASRYVVSDALLAGFFSDKHFISSVIDDTREKRGHWRTLGEQMRAPGSPGALFDADIASRLVVSRAIELFRLADGSFITPRTSDGRHRTVAMVALGAPLLPVLVATR